MPTPPPPEQRLALLLQYDGAAFAGSQSQPQLPTVQGALEQAVSELTGEHRRVSLAGRTDAGVHATGQVASLLTSRQLPPHRWIRGLNHFLPEALAVQALQPVSLEFDPRRNAIEREYHYDILVASQRRPLHEVRAWRVQPTFSIEAARDALTQLEGQHDFAAFTTTDQGRPTIRRLHEASITTTSTTTNTATQDRFTLRFRADAFLQHQVRRMVGAVVEVARGRASSDALRSTLETARPGSAGPTAPAKGLTLAIVRYDRATLPDWNTEYVHDCSQPT